MHACVFVWLYARSADLVALNFTESSNALIEAGLNQETAESAHLLAITLPTLHVRVKVCCCDGAWVSGQHLLPHTSGAGAA